MMISRALYNYFIFLKQLFVLFFLFSISSCTDYFKNDYNDNSPTSGKLKVYYDEGLELHVKNQAFTFQSQYYNAHLDLFQSAENDAVKALYNDSCESIIISRQLTLSEQKAFESNHFSPKYSAVAKSGVLLITNTQTPIQKLSYKTLLELLTIPYSEKDSLGNEFKLKVLLDKNNSSLVHYLKDTIIKGQKFSSEVNILHSSIDAINYVAQNKNTIAFIDFSWLSDRDDSIYKANANKIKFIAVGTLNNSNYEYPNQSSFKLGTYPLTRTIYVYRKTGDFSLAKGFESFVAGPKGQLTFLKQGLLPTRQGERAIEVKLK